MRRPAMHMRANMLRGGLPGKHGTDVDSDCAGIACKTCA